MCMTALSALLIPALGCGLDAAPAVTALTSHELGSIRGGQGFSYADFGETPGRVARDPMVRDVALAQTVTQQQMDAWWADSGAALLAAGPR